MNLNHLQATRTWLDRSLELTWLAAVVVVPLITLPGSEFVTLMGLPKTVALRVIASIAAALWTGHFAVWITERALFDTGASRDQKPEIAFDVPDWRTMNGLIVWCAVGLGIATLISTLLSIDPSVSLWGKRSASEGYGLYSTLSLLVIFFAVALKLRGSTQLWRILWTLTGVGVASALIGIAQSFDLWPLRDPIYPNRASGHAGNPIPYGGLLLMLFPLSVATVTAKGLRSATFIRLWLPLFWVHFVFMYAVGLTLSRGPYLGMAITMVAIPVLTAWYADRKLAVRLAAVSCTSVVFVAALMIPAGHGSFGAPDYFDGSQVEDAADLEDLGDRISNGQTISTRLQTWRAAEELIVHRPNAPGGAGSNSRIIRDLFGYGPDQFKYTMPLTADNEAFRRITAEAHNDLINRAVEVGALGLGAFLAVIATALITLVSTLRKARRTGNLVFALVATAMVASIAGRMVEQQVGIARNADLILFWVLLGVIVNLPRLSGATLAPTHRRRLTRPEMPHLPAVKLAAAYSFGMIAAGIITVALAAFTWQKNIDYLIADHQVRLARELRATDPDKALAEYQAARQNASDVSKYEIEIGNYYGTLADSTLNQSERLAFLQANYEADLRALEINQFERDSNFQVAESAWKLALEGDATKLAVAIDRYRFLTQIAPEYLLARERLQQLQNILSG
jgi:O-antigen ligase